jgi:PTH2 family peptidyl-tRNA hydrolase
MKSNTKQVIVVRKDLNMRKGKMAAQCCHASMAFLTHKLEWCTSHDGFAFHTTQYINTERCLEIDHWLKNSFRKIVCYVNSEEELVALHQKATDAGLISHLIEDNGATEFNGVKTKTAIAIGPHFEDKFVGITDSLPLM